jgi:hypothetical protein
MMQALIEDWREWQEAIWEGVRGPDMREPYPSLHFEWSFEEIEDEACRRETRLVYIYWSCAGGVSDNNCRFTKPEIRALAPVLFRVPHDHPLHFHTYRPTPVKALYIVLSQLAYPTR